MSILLRSIDPFTGAVTETFEPMGPQALERALAAAAGQARDWGSRPVSERGALLRSVGRLLRKRRTALARLITLEMGKRIGEAEAEIEKCALVCDYCADQGEKLLADTPVRSDARRSLVTYQPLGVVLAIMPWNFPFWQVMRCAAPALIAGNVVLLKHASNVPGCAQAIARLFQEVGAPDGVFQTLLIDASRAEAVVADPRVRAVSLTGSESAGRRVAAIAGAHLKKTLLELGGSDPFVVLEDADLEQAVATAVTARFLNAGQSCIAAKRFILVEAVAEPFLERLRAAIAALTPGNPLEPETRLAPLARADLRVSLHAQVETSLRAGARLLIGGQIPEHPGWIYPATLIDAVAPGMPAYEDELFGPVAAVIRARDAQDALRIANDSRFGLGGSVWTSDLEHGERFARGLECGCAFVNGLVKSDPRLPFGGIKDSGYGRELGEPGLKEFLNIKTLWIG